jgi:hypothetical protein
MSETEAKRPARSPAMLAMVVAPIVVGVGLLAATAAWYFTVQRTGGAGTGPEIEVGFVAECGGDSAKVESFEQAITARMDDLGLAPRRLSRQDGTWTYSIRTPGVLPDESTHLPGVIAAPGKLVVLKDGAPLALAPKDVGFQLAFSGTPITLVVFGEPLPESGVTATLDGAPLEIEQASGVELQIASRAADSVTAVRTGTERTVQIRHPLPCLVRVVP